MIRPAADPACHGSSDPSKKFCSSSCSSSQRNDYRRLLMTFNNQPWRGFGQCGSNTVPSRFQCGVQHGSTSFPVFRNDAGSTNDGLRDSSHCGSRFGPQFMQPSCRRTTCCFDGLNLCYMYRRCRGRIIENSMKRLYQVGVAETRRR